MSLFNTQKKKIGNATAGETKLPKKDAAKKETKAVAVVKADKKAGTKAEKREAAVQGVVFPKGSAVIKPRVTEKAGLLSQNAVYTFEVRKDANSREIAKAIAEAYKVEPVKVSIAPIKSKAMFVRGKRGKTVAGKKAYVYLKKGQTIEFI
ncbi:MAG: 50S ribosomal protein L23 [Candidatus Taylorbacteria bacterium]|nr:50S ribosomal protein L23 [Candidatus Taylorbacteria bacterium]